MFPNNSLEFSQTTYCGYVALLGAPNAGKSTLLNALVGEPLSIVTPKAQTTWRRITGIRTTDRHQAIFLDTPGIVVPGDLLHRSFLASAGEAAVEADLLVLVADPTRPLDQDGRSRILEVASGSRAPRIGVINKVDVASVVSVAEEREWLKSVTDAGVLEVSAEEKKGIEELLSAINAVLPSAPFLYPEDEIGADPVRFFVAEMVRGAIFELFREEVPYSSYCEVEEFREGGKRTYIHVVIYVERSSQKGILVGDGGRAIRDLGTRARRRIEAFLGDPVYLELWVKVLPGWRKKKEHLRRFGLNPPDRKGDSDG